MKINITIASVFQSLFCSIDERGWVGEDVLSCFKYYRYNIN